MKLSQLEFLSSELGNCRLLVFSKIFLTQLNKLGAVGSYATLDLVGYVGTIILHVSGGENSQLHQALFINQVIIQYGYT